MLRAELISGTAITLFALYWCLALYRQGKKIWQTKSGAGVSTPFMLYFYFLGTVYATYGIQHYKWPMIAHGTGRGIFYAYILLGLVKYKGLTRAEMLVLWPMVLTPIIQSLTPWGDNIFLVLSAGGVLIGCFQPYEFWKNKSVGVYHFPMIPLTLTANTFWFVYSLAVQDVLLVLICLAYYVPMLATLGLYLRYKSR